MTSLQLNYPLPLRKDITYIHLLYALVSIFILTSNLKHVNKGGAAWKGYPGVQGEKEKKKKNRKQQSNTSAVLHKLHVCLSV